MNASEILKKTFDQMGNCFTSQEFAKKAIKNGYSRDLITRNGGLAPFLKMYATNDPKYIKTWIKNTSIIERPKPIELEGIDYCFKSIDDVIRFVKSKGYKVLKPVNNWEEI